jgi:biopolymer transport protein ExbB/TolQ
MNGSLRKARWYLAATIVAGAVTFLSPFIGMIGTVEGMIGAFDEMVPSGVKDPDVLSEGIGEVLIATAAGFGVAILGFPLFIVFLVLLIRERRRIKQQLAVPMDWTA